MKDMPKTGTGAAEQFFASWREINRLFQFVLQLVGRSEQAASTAHEVLVETAKSDEERKKLEKDWGEREKRGPVAELKNNRQLFLEVMLVRHIENYLNYLSSLLYEIFVSRPETLKSSDKVEVAKILDHESIESFVRSLAERKVESLSYSSFRNVTMFFQDRFGLSLADDSEMNTLNEFIEIRNISVHNRCIVNQRFVSRLTLDPKLIGKKKRLFIADLDRLVPQLLKIVTRVDRDARKKLKIKGKRFARG